MAWSQETKRRFYKSMSSEVLRYVASIIAPRKLAKVSDAERVRQLSEMADSIVTVALYSASLRPISGSELKRIAATLGAGKKGARQATGNPAAGRGRGCACGR